MSLPTAPFEGIVYRAHHPRWAFEPASGIGASQHGGRFNRPGIPTLYTSLRVETAWLEAQHGFAFKAQPLTICAYKVNCADVLDLSSPGIREAAGFSLDDLGCAWEDLADQGSEPPTWGIAQCLMNAGIAGVIVPSFASRATPEDRNLVFWTWEDAKPHFVRVIDDHERLPKNDLSWKRKSDG